METLYPMIFKRKSFHIFKDRKHISIEELNLTKTVFSTLKPLNPDIKISMEIVLPSQTNCQRGQEYCLLLYSEPKENYLQNIGYIGEQLDLYLASLDIGSLWYGIGKPEDTIEHDLDYVIMLAIVKMPKEKFRKDMFKSKCKPLEDIWIGEDQYDIAHIVRFAPSACNSQPWIVDADDQLSIYRYKKPGKRGIMPINKVTYYNRIDIGIFLLFVELCLEHQGYSFERQLFDDYDEQEKTLTALYSIKKEHH